MTRIEIITALIAAKVSATGNMAEIYESDMRYARALADLILATPEPVITPTNGDANANII